MFSSHGASKITAACSTCSFLEGMSFLCASHNIRRFVPPPCATLFVLSAGPEDTPPVLGTIIDCSSVQSFGSVCKQRTSQGRSCFRNDGQDREDTSAFHLEHCEDQIHVFPVAERLSGEWLVESSRLLIRTLVSDACRCAKVTR
jgi:hypothetical protein